MNRATWSPPGAASGKVSNRIVISTIGWWHISGPSGLGEVAVHEGVGEPARDGLPGDEYPVVNGVGELVDREVDVGAVGQLAASGGPAEGRAVALTLLGDDLGFEAGRDGGGVLRLSGEGTEDRAGVGGGQECGELGEVIAQVVAEVSVVGGGEELVGVGDEGVEQDVALGVPPAVDGVLGYPGPGGYAFDRQVGEAALDE